MCLSLHMRAGTHRAQNKASEILGAGVTAGACCPMCMLGTRLDYLAPSAVNWLLRCENILLSNIFVYVLLR